MVSPRQGGVTLSISDAEFVGKSSRSSYLRTLLKGFGCTQRDPTEIWEDNTSCIMMSENLTNRDRSRHVDVKVHFLRDLVRDGHMRLLWIMSSSCLPIPMYSKKCLVCFCAGG